MWGEDQRRQPGAQVRGRGEGPGLETSVGATESQQSPQTWACQKATGISLHVSCFRLLLVDPSFFPLGEPVLSAVSGDTPRGQRSPAWGRGQGGAGAGTLGHSAHFPACPALFAAPSVGNMLGPQPPLHQHGH